MTGVWRSLELPEGSPKTKINKAFRDVVGRYEEECAEEIERNPKKNLRTHLRTGVFP